MNAPLPRRAAALSYDEHTDAAPRVVAKGHGAVAEQIVQRAVQAGVPIMESEALAQALVKVELDAQVPAQLYLAVAEVLAWVYRLDAEVQKHHAGATQRPTTPTPR